MKTCLIFGHDGLDLDVSFNIKSFYNSLGYFTVFSEKIYSADILIILRATNRSIDLSFYNFSNIIIYDYGGWSYEKLLKSVDLTKTILFTTSEDTKVSLLKNKDFEKLIIHVEFPPVDINIWSFRLRKTKYNFVHIGNYKPNNAEDEIQEKFNAAILNSEVDVWGNNWINKISAKNYHGKVGLFNVSKIYCKSRIGFGLMYPFQRDKTFSGRFWHAPLNGCAILSEKGKFTKLIPGVYETDYSKNNLNLLINNLAKRENIQKESKLFWENKWNSHYEIVNPILKDIKSQKTIPYSLYYLRIINILRYLYQKLEIFKII